MVRENIRALAEDPEGTLWIGTDSGLLRYRTARSHALARPTACPRGRCARCWWTGTVCSGSAPSAGLSLVATAGSRPPASRRWPARPSRGCARPPTGPCSVARWRGSTACRAAVEAVRRGGRASRRSRPRGLPGSGGEIWVGTATGVARLAGADSSGRGSRRHCRRFGPRHLGGPPREPLAGARAPRPRPATRASGWRSSARRRGFPATTSMDFVEDRQGNLWVGSFDAGVTCLRADAVLGLRPARGAPDRRRAEHPPGERRRVWIGMSGGGVTRVDRPALTTFGMERGLADDSMLALAEDPVSGTIWVGTTRGLSRSTADGPDDPDPASMLARRRAGVRLVGPDGAALDWHRPGWVVGLRSGDCAVRRRPRDAVSPRGSRAARSSPTAGCGWRRTKAWPTSRTAARRRTPPRTAWATTSSCRCTATSEGDALGGDVRGRPEPGRKDGHPHADRSATASSTTRRSPILEDDRGAFWMSCNKRHLPGARGRAGGLLRREGGPDPLQAYGMADGLRGTEGNGGSQPAAWKTDDGRLWFATIRGAVIVDPSSMRAGLPDVVLEHVIHDRRQAAAVGALDLPPGDRRAGGRVHRARLPRGAERHRVPLPAGPLRPRMGGSRRPPGGLLHQRPAGPLRVPASPRATGTGSGTRRRASGRHSPPAALLPGHVVLAALRLRPGPRGCRRVPLARARDDGPRTHARAPGGRADARAARGNRAARAHAGPAGAGDRRAPAGPGGTGAGQGARRGGQPGQERVPGQHEPRDPHADERHHRHDRAAARHAA